MMYIWLVLSVLTTRAGGIRLVNNGYEDIVVAVHDSVSQDDGYVIIEELKAMFRAASPFLYESLGKRVYFRNVTILLPEIWHPDPTWSFDTTLTFKEADVRVDGPHPLHGNDPYVFQPGQCGEPGKYIHFTPEFLINENFRDANYGDAGRVLVHEFAHFRYGVFDELGFRGSKNHPLWYLDGNEVVPTGCTKGIQGQARENGGECFSRRRGIIPTDDCIFQPNLNNNAITASIMAYYYLKNVTQFCTNDDSGNQHNSLAPNQHNKMCNKRATYDVIMDHADFQGMNGPREGLDVTPTFTIVQSKKAETCGRRTVLVLDLSGSMQTSERYFKVGQAGDRLIRDILPKGTEFGVVTFTEVGRVWIRMTVIDAESVRDTVASLLPEQDDFNGGTSISAGLDTALELLQENGKSTEDANIVLITDGETSEDLIALCLPNLLSAGIKVHSIGLGPRAEGTIGNLSSETGGSFSYYSESETSTDLDAAMERMLEYISVCQNAGGIEIDRRGILINAAMSPFIGRVFIDDTIGEHTIFSFSFPEGVSMRISLTDPEAQEYDHTAEEYSYDSARNIIRFRFNFSLEGEWTYQISTDSTSVRLVAFVAKSRVRANVTYPLEIESRLNTASINLEQGGSRAVITTYVHRGYQPMINANVIVTVDRSPDPPVTLHPKDDGLLPDNKEGDGVYSVYFTGFSGNQRISMQTRVDSIPGQTAVVVSGGWGSSAAASIYQNTTSEPVLEIVSNFSRTSSPGAVDVTGFTANSDLFPPGAVSDLKVMTFDKEERTVTLMWTSPGDDLTDGTADRYELRVADELETLLLNFSDCFLFSETDLIQGSLIPLPAGSPHNVTVNVPKDIIGDPYIFALKTFDETNRSSEISNFPSITFKSVYLQGKLLAPDPKTKPEVTKGPEVDDDPEPRKPPVSAIIIGCVVGGLVLLILLAAFLLVRRRRRRGSAQL